MRLIEVYTLYLSTNDTVYFFHLFECHIDLQNIKYIVLIAMSYKHDFIHPEELTNMTLQYYASHFNIDAIVE